MIEIPVIIGPTGSGKTELALSLAKGYGFVIINADSRKIYRYLDIGTAKPPKKDRKFYKLLDIIEPCESFSAYQWMEMAEKEIENLVNDGKRVIIEGASVLYLKALFEGFFEQPEIPPDIKEKAKVLSYEGKGYDILKEKDPETARKIHPNDKYRISRALEILLATGKPISFWRRFKRKPKFKPIYLFIDIPRDVLYRKLEHRARVMFEEGLIEETKEILKIYPCFKEWGKKVVAYRQSLEFLEGKYDYETAIRKKYKADKILARRQIRFMKTLEPRMVIPYDHKERILSYLHL